MLFSRGPRDGEPPITEEPALTGLPDFRPQWDHYHAIADKLVVAQRAVETFIQDQILAKERNLRVDAPEVLACGSSSVVISLPELEEIDLVAKILKYPDNSDPDNFLMLGFPLEINETMEALHSIGIYNAAFHLECRFEYEADRFFSYVLAYNLEADGSMIADKDGSYSGIPLNMDELQNQHKQLLAKVSAAVGTGLVRFTNTPDSPAMYLVDPATNIGRLVWEDFDKFQLTQSKR